MVDAGLSICKQGGPGRAAETLSRHLTEHQLEGAAAIAAAVALHVPPCSAV